MKIFIDFAVIFIIEIVYFTATASSPLKQQFNHDFITGNLKTI